MRRSENEYRQSEAKLPCPGFPGFDESRTIELERDVYRKWLSKATRDLAYLGALESRLHILSPEGQES